MEATEWLIAAGCPIGEVNVGGGIGVPARDDEPAVDLDAYAALLARHLGPLGVIVAAEPGDYLSKDAAILLGEVVTVEERGGVTFVGLDLGWNLNCAYFIYGYLQEILPVAAVDAPRTEVVTVAGHINEASDVFAEDYPMAPVAEGDIVALLNAGGYHQAMSSIALPSPDGERDLPGSLRSPQLRTRSIAIRISGRRLEVVVLVLRVLRAKGGDCRGAFDGVLGKARATVDPEPCQVCPVLVPAVDEHCHVGSPLDVANAGELARVGRLLRFLVDRREQHIAVEDEADRDEARPPVLGDRPERGSSRLGDEAAVLAGQRHARTPPGQAFVSGHLADASTHAEASHRPTGCPAA